MAQPTTVPSAPTLPLDHSGPWTEADFLALPEGSRVELLDGSLLVSPRGRAKHQLLGGRLFAVLDSCKVPEWRVFPEFEVRLGRDRIFIADITVVDVSVGPEDAVVDAEHVGLVVEIASPSTVMLDRHVKTRAYAEARIPRLLRVEFTPDGPVGELLSLDDGGYRTVQRAEPGETLRVDEPFPVDLDLAALLADS